MLQKNKFLPEILLGISLVAIGFGVQLLFPEGVPKLKYPTNLQVGLFFSVILLSIYLYVSKLTWIRILASPKLSIVAMILVAIFVLCTGLIPQKTDTHDILSQIGLRTVVNSWYFAFSVLLLLTNLGLVLLKHTTRLTWKNFAFILNHLGLWLVLLAGYLGSGDIVKLRSECGVGGSCTIAFDDNNLAFKLPFNIQLVKFERKDYTPTLVSIHSQTNMFRNVSDNLNLNNTYLVNGESFKIISFDTLQNEINGIKVKWNNDTLLLTTGLSEKPIQVATLGNDSLLLLKRGSAKSYTSFIRISDKNYQISINNPLKYKGWIIYQISYEEGKNGEIQSVFEFMRDPWLPVVYTGFIMILLGAVFLFWESKNNKTTEI